MGLLYKGDLQLCDCTLSRFRDGNSDSSRIETIVAVLSVCDPLSPARIVSTLHDGFNDENICTYDACARGFREHDRPFKAQACEAFAREHTICTSRGNINRGNHRSRT